MQKHKIVVIGQKLKNLISLNIQDVFNVSFLKTVFTSSEFFMQGLQ